MRPPAADVGQRRSEQALEAGLVRYVQAVRSKSQGRQLKLL